MSIGMLAMLCLAVTPESANASGRNGEGRERGEDQIREDRHDSVVTSEPSDRPMDRESRGETQDLKFDVEPSDDQRWKTKHPYDAAQLEWLRREYLEGEDGIDARSFSNHDAKIMDRILDLINDRTNWLRKNPAVVSEVSEVSEAEKQRQQNMADLATRLRLAIEAEEQEIRNRETERQAAEQEEQERNERARNQQEAAINRQRQRRRDLELAFAAVERYESGIDRTRIPTPLQIHQANQYKEILAFRMARNNTTGVGNFSSQSPSTPQRNNQPKPTWGHNNQ